jgi:hypothetical protein
MPTTPSSTALATIDFEAIVASPAMPAAKVKTEAANLAKLANKVGLSLADVEVIAYVRGEHGASLSTVQKHLEQGYTPEQVMTAYDARSYLEESIANRDGSGEPKGSPTINGLLEAADWFIEGDDPERFQELLGELKTVLNETEYCDSVVKLATRMAKKQELRYLSDVIEQLR